LEFKEHEVREGAPWEGRGEDNADPKPETWVSDLEKHQRKQDEGNVSGGVGKDRTTGGVVPSFS
jgi:hypothetical protein